MNGSNPPPWAGKFTPREIGILSLVSEGLSNQEISQRLFLSLDTVKWYNKHLFARLGVTNRTQAANKARQYNLFQSHEAAYPQEEIHLNHNLPAQLTSFVGRERQGVEIQELVLSSRLVVLTGAGGTGKTRLALQVAEAVASNYRHGVWFVELAMQNDPTRVPDSIASELKVSTVGIKTPGEILKRYLSGKQLLLLLDNFEHLMAAAPYISELLDAAPQLSVLATSRERLRLYGEVDYAVQPLSAPDRGQKSVPQELLRYEAVELFIQRARNAKPSLEMNDKNIVAAAQICERLDGLPLAIELAASQVKIFSLSGLAQRLDGNLEALGIGPRNHPDRQKTLQATISWSFNMLNDQEKRFFSQLSVFNGGCDLAAIQYVSASSLDGNFLNTLISLVDKNLVYVREDSSGEPRFYMLNTIRAFADEKLVASGEAETAHRLHASFYVKMAEQYQQELHSPVQHEWDNRIENERGNLSAALGWAFGTGEPILGLRLIAALSDHWYPYGRAEDAHWMELALEKMSLATLPLQAAVLKSAGSSYYSFGDFPRAGDLLQKSADLFQQLGDQSNVAWVFSMLSNANSGEAEEIDNCFKMARRSLEISQILDDKSGIAYALSALGELWRLKGDYSAARECYEQSLEINQDSHELIRQAITCINLSFTAYHQEEYRLAILYSLQSLEIVKNIEIPDLSTWLCSLAGPLAVLGKPETAARLLGAAQAELDIYRSKMQPADQKELDHITALVRHSLDERHFQENWQAGYSMSSWQALDFALSEIIL